MKIRFHLIAFAFVVVLIPATFVYGQIGTQFPSERKVIKDPITGTELTFLTSTPQGDKKIYQTHPQWTSDAQWLIFRSDRVKGEAMAVNEKDGTIVQVSEGGYTGMLNVARNSMNLYFMRNADSISIRGEGRTLQIVEVDLAVLFADSKAGTLKQADNYQRVCGTIPAEKGAGGDMALDANEDFAYFRVGPTEAAKHLAPDTKLEEDFGPRKMGAGPAGLAKINIKTGEISYIISVPFQIGHVQSNPWVPGEIIFCWETGGKSPQRTWMVNADGTGLRPLYPEADYEWVTHEAVITRDEVAIAIMGHRKIPNTNSGIDAAGTDVKGANPGQESAWGPSGTREKPTGLGIVNLRTREMILAGQTPSGSGLWHVNGSADGRWAVGDDFSRSIYLIDRHTHEMILLTTGHLQTAEDHTHPSFSADGTRIEIQSAMLSEDKRSMNICIIPVPQTWLDRKYSTISPE
ncbi:MAG: hypothetical protein ACERKD_02730 [Prolixibacteraceae bacterium]